MSSMEIFVIAVCGFLGFFIVSKMMEAKGPEPNDEVASANTNRAQEEQEDTSDQKHSKQQRDTEGSTQRPHWSSVLGVSPEANGDEVRTAYRALIRKYHPDKVAGLGNEFRIMAEQKSKEINEAYSDYNNLNKS